MSPASSGEEEKWRRTDPTHIRVGEILEIGTDSYYPYDSSAEAALIDQILREHEQVKSLQQDNERLREKAELADWLGNEGHNFSTARAAIDEFDARYAALTSAPEAKQ